MRVLPKSVLIGFIFYHLFIGPLTEESESQRVKYLADQSQTA